MLEDFFRMVLVGVNYNISNSRPNALTDYARRSIRRFFLEAPKANGLALTLETPLQNRHRIRRTRNAPRDLSPLA